jgi:hypothetical protein
MLRQALVIVTAWLLFHKVNIQAKVYRQIQLYLTVLTTIEEIINRELYLYKILFILHLINHSKNTGACVCGVTGILLHFR